jgi:Zn-dependent protease with chaperone function
MIDAIYYDGNTSRRNVVSVVIHKRVLSMRGTGLQRSERVSRMALSERLEHAPRILRFADGAFIEVDDQKPLDAMLLKNKFFDSRVVQWQNNWPLSLLALVAVLAILLSAYQWGIPAAADRLAQRLPPAMEKRLGDESLASMDRGMLGPSRLPKAEQDRLRALFAAMHQPREEHTPYQLEFRMSRVGPNAFALPNSVIVLTDEMVEEAGSDEAIMGVLSHELGHLQRRHTGRFLLKTIGVGVILNLWVGDLSSAMAAVPEMLLRQKHSRDFEREADQYAIDMMAANDLPLEPMAQMFVALSKPRPAPAAAQDEEEEEDGADEAPQAPRAPPTPQAPGENYLSSHPADAERIATLRAADAQRPKKPVPAPAAETSAEAAPAPAPLNPTASVPGSP